MVLFSNARLQIFIAMLSVSKGGPRNLAYSDKQSEYLRTVCPNMSSRRYHYKVMVMQFYNGISNWSSWHHFYKYILSMWVVTKNVKIRINNVKHQMQNVKLLLASISRLYVYYLYYLSNQKGILGLFNFWKVYVKISPESLMYS